MPNTNRLIGEPVVEALFVFSWNPKIPCLHLLSLDSKTVRQDPNKSGVPTSDGASHQAKHSSATLIGFCLQQALSASLLVFVDGTKAKVTLDGMERLEDSGMPSGQLVAFQDMVSLRGGSGRVLEK